MCNTSNFKCFPCVVWILTTTIPALSSESQNNLMYGFPPNSRPGRDSTFSDEHRTFAAAAFTEHFLTFLCLVPTETLLKVHAGVREGLLVPCIGRVVPKCRKKSAALTRIEDVIRYKHYDMAGHATEVAAYKRRFRFKIEFHHQDARVYRQHKRHLTHAK